jgi:hypothetical protein
MTNALIAVVAVVLGLATPAWAQNKVRVTKTRNFKQEYEKAKQAYESCRSKALDPHSTSTLDDCKMPSTFLRCMAAYDSAGLCKTIAAGYIKNGFTEKQVEMSWGKPEHINTTCVEGSCTAQWVYETNDVYFTNGRVDGWDASQ